MPVSPFVSVFGRGDIVSSRSPKYLRSTTSIVLCGYQASGRSERGLKYRVRDGEPLRCEQQIWGILILVMFDMSDRSHQRCFIAS